jgi:DNA-binding transcriptional LysR family regulator
MMDWDDLRFALALARAGNLAKAARSLGVAHTTVARRIAAFEEALSAPLFDRVGGDCTPTPVGKDLVEMAIEIEAKVNAFERRLSSRDADLEGNVVVATTEPLAAKLTEHVLAFGRLHPSIRVRIHATNAAVDLAKREADIALRITAAPPESLVGRKLANIAFAIYGTQGSSRASSSWVVFDASLETTPQGKWEAEHVPAERVALRTNSRVVFVEAVTAGAGIGVLPCGVAAQLPTLLQHGDVIPELTLPLWILTHEDLKDTPRVRALFDFLLSVFAREKPLLEGHRAAAHDP